MKINDKNQEWRNLGIEYASAEYWRWYRQVNGDKLRAYHKKYDSKRFKTHYVTEKARRQKYLENNPIKARAHTLLHNATRSGRVIKDVCRQCGSERVIAHHDNYGKPLEVIWLCEIHHKERHRYLISINHSSDPTIAELEDMFKKGKPGRRKGPIIPEKS